MQHRRRSFVHQQLRLQHGGVQALAASHHNQRPSEAYKKWHHQGCQGLPRFDSTTMTVFEKKHHKKRLRMYVVMLFECYKFKWISMMSEIYGYNLVSCWQCPSLTHWIHLFLELENSNKKPMPGPSQWVFYLEPAPAATSSHLTSVATILQVSMLQVVYFPTWMVDLYGSDGIPTKPIPVTCR